MGAEQPRHRRRPPFLLLVSGGALLVAPVFLLVGRFELGIGALLLHWLLGAIVLARRYRGEVPPPDQGSRR